jgi:tRNA-specific 2-thiouridylase
MLVEQGYEVIGATMQIWSKGVESDSGGCCSLSAVEDARRVATKIGIPHYVFPMEDVFARHVIQDFIDEYRRGHTPNPCVRCNQFVKFDELLTRARALGAEYVATGHYARVSYDDDRRRWLLLRGLDRTKDQSYALYTLTQEQLAHTLFPVGEITKKETRQRAADLGLAVAGKPDSQEICFVPDKNYPAFLEQASPELVKPGAIVDTTGKVLGEHRGIAFYTVGQRKRLGISAGKPRYVIGVDRETNTVVVGDNEELFAKRVVAKDMNLISIAELPNSLAVTGKIRYNTKDSAAVVRSMFKSMVEVVFDQPQRAITPGQAVVLYQGEVVVGGGTIVDDREAESGVQSAEFTVRSSE